MLRIPFPTVLLLAAASAVCSATAGSVAVREGVLRTEGLAWVTQPDAGLLQQVPGPLPGVVGIKAAGEPVVLRGRLEQALQQAGTLTFWFATDRMYRSGSNVQTTERKLVEIAETLSISFISEPSAVTLIVEWGSPRQLVYPRHIRIILPEFPGPAWHHMAVTWNGPTGAMNAYLDGTPYFIPGEKLAPMPMLPGGELVLHPATMALADVQVQAGVLDAAAIAAAVPAAYRGKLDRLLGATDLGTLSADGRRGDVLYESRMKSADDTKGWVLEGPGIITFRDGWMEMRSQRPDGPQGHLVNWCPVIFPERFVAEWDFEFLDEKGLCIVFFAARGKDGLDLFDPRLARRTGEFNQYVMGDIDAYHVSYFANTPGEPRSVANVRKNRGAHLLANGPIGVRTAKPGEVHRALLIKDGAHIQMSVNGRKIIDYVDDGQRAGPVLTDGRMGLRQMQWTSARYRNFRVSALKE